MRWLKRFKWSQHLPRRRWSTPRHPAAAVYSRLLSMQALTDLEWTSVSRLLKLGCTNGGFGPLTNESFPSLGPSVPQCLTTRVHNCLTARQQTRFPAQSSLLFFTMASRVNSSQSPGPMPSSASKVSKSSEEGKGQESKPADKTKPTSKARELWNKLGLDLGTVLIMMKYNLPIDSSGRMG
jgi:hypothetical protein